MDIQEIYTLNEQAEKIMNMIETLQRENLLTAQLSSELEQKLHGILKRLDELDADLAAPQYLKKRNEFNAYIDAQQHCCDPLGD
jgi:hypothetical protein